MLLERYRLLARQRKWVERIYDLRAANGTAAGITASSKMGRLNVAMSTVVSSNFEESRSVSSTEETNLVTEGPIRTGLVLPMMMAIFFGVEADSAIVFGVGSMLALVLSESIFSKMLVRVKEKLRRSSAQGT